MLVVSSVGGSVVVVVLVDVVVLVVVDVVVVVLVVVDVVVAIDSCGASVIGGFAESEPEQPATIVAAHTANRRPT
jgi:hypothetical protein